MIAVQRMSVRAVLRDRVIVRRAIAGAAVGLVGVAVLANTVFRPTNVVSERVPDARVNAPADAVARSFAAAYLLVGRTGEERARALAPFGANSAWDVSVRGGVRRRVVSSQIAAVSVRADNGDRIATVEAELEDGTRQYLAVRTRTHDGVVSIVGAPAIVGAPVIGQAVAERETQGDAASDEVTETVTRAMRHLLAGRRGDLVPDLAPGAQVALPATALELVDVVSVTWVRRPGPGGGSAQARLVARDSSGVELTLDYELDLLRNDQGRWQLAAVHLPAAA